MKLKEINIPKLTLNSSIISKVSIISRFNFNQNPKSILENTTTITFLSQSCSQTLNTVNLMIKCEGVEPFIFLD